MYQVKKIEQKTVKKQMNNDKNLIELTEEFFGQKFNVTRPENFIRGESGYKWNFDLLVQDNEDKYGVFVKQWNRSIGVNQVRQLQKACRDTDCVGGILVGDQISPNARKFATNMGIQVFTRHKIISRMR